MINSTIALMFGIYLIMVVWGNNQSKLLSLISQEVGFLKWAGAIVTLSFLINTADDKTGGTLKGLGLLALMALFLGNGEKIFTQVSEIFGDIKK